MAKPTLLTSPHWTLFYFTIVVLQFLRKIFTYLVRFWYLVLLVMLITIAPRFVEGQHKQLITQADEVGYFMLYWIILGVASSIGLGTGLHTFVLYLGPHIAKITLYSYECNDLPQMIPSKWNVEKITCPSNPNGISFLEILISVQFEAFLWGFGTALGELPPYFVARAAALANKQAEELDELKEAENKKTLINRIKLIIYNQLQSHAFITVLLCASIPNPLFDLAGITCGHFLIPFITFFGATSIGKAIIKVHIQMLFVIFVFSKEHVDSLVNFVANNLAFLHGPLLEMLEKQKKLLHDPSTFQEGTKPLVAQLWDYFIMLMIGYFVLSIINSLVAQYLDEQEQSKSNPKEQKKQKKE